MTTLAITLALLATAQTPREDFAKELEASAARFAAAKAQVAEARRRAELPGKLADKLAVIRRVRLDLIQAYACGLGSGPLALRSQVLSRHIREADVVVLDVEKSLPSGQAIPLATSAREQLEVAKAAIRVAAKEISR